MRSSHAKMELRRPSVAVSSGSDITTASRRLLLLPHGVRAKTHGSSHLSELPRWSHCRCRQPPPRRTFNSHHVLLLPLNIGHGYACLGSRSSILKADRG